jgi:hypothetical protein
VRKKADNPDGRLKSWRTSHLPGLQEKEQQGLLDLMYAWYHHKRFEFSKGCNWPILWEYIDRHGLGGLLGSAVLDGICHISEEFSRMASHRYFSIQMHYEQTRKCCSAVSKAAQELNIPVRIFKGPAIVHQGYVDTGVRSFSDIDVFTDSLENVYRLCEKLQGTIHKASAAQNLLERIGESECISFFYKNWELEFRYPLEPPGEPMFELLSRHKDSLLQVPVNANDILEPDASLHLVFLIQHMAVHHLFSRFFWFLDLAVLARSNARIDYELVKNELHRLGLNNAAYVAGQFCRKYIDPDFPVFTQLKPCWNYPIMTRLTAPGNIADGRFGIYHRKFRQKAFAYIFGLVSFYIIADPAGKRFGFGTDWTLNRFRNSFGIKKPILWIDFLLRPVIALVLVPIAWILSYVACRAKG